VLSGLTGSSSRNKRSAANLADLTERFPLTFMEAGPGDEDEKLTLSVRLLCAAIQTTCQDG
jgi:hypothetical protein